jgi:dihydrofolate reductase
MEEKMGKLVVSNIVSLDGKYADANGNPLALNMDGSFDDYNLERIRQAAAVLLGRNSFDMFSSYWPLIADAPEAPGNSQFSVVNREFSRTYNALPKFVVTDSEPPAAENAWYSTTTVISQANAVAWANSARDDLDGDIVVFGSHQLWNSLLAAGVVDELHFLISPGALGDGVPVFQQPVSLNLLEVRTFDASGNVLLRYAPV